MLPRRCKKCRCYVAPQLKKCPRCGTVAPAVVSKPTKEDKQEARAAMDEKVPVVHGKSIHWAPSEYALRAHQEKLKELDRMLAKAETPRARNAIRSEVRLAKTLIAKKQAPADKKRWTTERTVAHHDYVTIFISPKGNKYVLAERDAPADLIVIPASKKHRLGAPTIRLQRFEKSGHWKRIQKEQKDAVKLKARHKSKKTHRAKKRMVKRSAES